MFSFLNTGKGAPGRPRSILRHLNAFQPQKLTQPRFVWRRLGQGKAGAQGCLAIQPQDALNRCDRPNGRQMRLTLPVKKGDLARLRLALFCA